MLFESNRSHPSIVPASPWTRRSLLAALGWLLAPLAYFAYSLVRGPIAHWYPYPFLDPRSLGGYGRVALYAVVLAVAMGLLAAGVNAIGRRRSGAFGRHRVTSLS